MKQIRPLLPIFILLSVFLFSCRDLRELQVTGVKGFTVKKIDTKGVEGDILLGLKNPNPYGFSIYKSTFDVSYSGIYLGKAKLAKRVRIKANQEDTYAFNLKGDLSQVNLVDVMKLLNGSSFKNTIEIKGNLRAGKFYLIKKIPVDVKENIRLN
jgi:LEA14-like dessication related protein